MAKKPKIIEPKRGGVRSGAGRKRKYAIGKAQRVSVLIPSDLLRSIDDDAATRQVSRSTIILERLQS